MVSAMATSPGRYEVLDPSLNRIPDGVEHIHLTAACGTGMGALAALLKDLGLQVTGSDHNVYPPMSTFLERKGIVLQKGFAAANLAQRPDLVVIGNVVTKDNVEVREIGALGLHYCSLPQAVNHFTLGNRQTVQVTGTHGKTTTASLVACICQVAGLDPGFMIGGILQDFNSNYQAGGGHVFIVEGDEYDTAFFDKGPKFLHYQSHVTILTSIEFDHADIYDDVAQIKSAFGRLMTNLASDSLLLAFDQDSHIDQVLDRAGCQIQRYGNQANSAWRLDHVTVTPPHTQFDIFYNGDLFGHFTTPMMGRHNLCNALAAVGAAHRLGIGAAAIAQALQSFQGVRRRQEIRGVKNGVTVIDDFAHHPTAVRETVAAVRTNYPEQRLIAAFEPRTNTSMRDIFQHVYPQVFDPADVVCVRQAPLLSKIPAGQRFCSQTLVKDLRNRGREAHFFENTDDLIAFLSQHCRPGDVVLVMSNGGFDNIHQRLLDIL
jgi:UDP-N-acetylmuramate: L-alanyl-gamma-D-glutamyl-meso-diaminopimelate ligase